HAPTIQLAELSQHEKNLLHAGGAQSVFAFDYRLPKYNMKYIDVWVDYYENGKKGEGFVGHTSGIEEIDKGRFILSLREPTVQNDSLEKWILTFLTGEGSSRSTYIRKEKPLQGIKVVSKREEPVKIHAGKPIVLAVMVKDPDAHSITVGSDVYRQPAKLRSLISRYEKVYVLRCKFRTSPKGGM
ncbi:MAG TPA: hypothetical protein VFK27_06285, partial [Bacillales bacterium]|nr:hypothetical protein [Bacillales bacterium]